MSTMWTMADGTQIRIKDMTDSHLRNAIAMLERTCGERRHNYYAEGCAALSLMNGEMAQYAVESDIDYVAGMSDEEFLWEMTEYGELVGELESRKQGRRNWDAILERSKK